MWHAKTAEDVLREFNTDVKQGLTNNEAEQRINEYGYNELQHKKRITWLKILLNQFKSPLIWILILATIISFVLKEYIDGSVITGIIIINAILGFMQEFKAEKAIDALKKMASPKAKVVRNGRPIEIDSKLVVPGDILLLEAGEKIPADARILEAHTLQTQEASLTGESTPVEKTSDIINEKLVVADRKNMVYSGTIITKGRGSAVVVTTAMKTEFGKIAKLIQEAPEQETPLQKHLKKLGLKIGLIVLFLIIIIFFSGVFLDQEPVLTMFLTAVALAVAAIPEGLPAVVTISLALGTQKMIKCNALIRTLSSVETLGSVTVICSDKTGTLTHNEMTVRKIWVSGQEISVTGSGYKPEGEFKQDEQKIQAGKELEHLLIIGALCNDSKIEEQEKPIVLGDPTEGCLIVSAAKAGMNIEELITKHPRTEEIPFTSERKLMTTINSFDSKKLALTKGAPEAILNICDTILLNGEKVRLTNNLRKEILTARDKFASQALRVLAFASKDNITNTNEQTVESGMMFVGLQAMIDPPREEAKEAISKCKTAGIRVIMITGDHKITAQAIATELGIEGKAIEGKELKTSNLNEEIKNINIFTRVNPEDKTQIVAALQKLNHVVAMTGDGVNDAPALKHADIGIAMGIAGTDVAKEASDLILTDDNFASIVNAVEEGRTIYDNIKKFVIYLLSSNIGEVLTILVSILLSLPLPLLAVQILWINLVTDGAPATALAVEPEEPDVMQKTPRKKTEVILNKTRAIWILLVGIIIASGTLGVFYYGLKTRSPQDYAYTYAVTMAFTTLVLFQMFNVFNCKALDVSLAKKGILNNKWLLISVILSISLQVLVIYTPFFQKLFKTTSLSLFDWGIILLVSSSVLIFGELYKKVTKHGL